MFFVFSKGAGAPKLEHEYHAGKGLEGTRDVVCKPFGGEPYPPDGHNSLLASSNALFVGYRSYSTSPPIGSANDKRKGGPMSPPSPQWGV